MQLTFGDAKGMGKRKQTRRAIFLVEMEQVVPWKALLAQIELSPARGPCGSAAGPDGDDPARPPGLISSVTRPRAVPTRG